jgi:putative transposase
MYSYEDRVRAVKLFIKFGKRTGPTIQQLGYPTKNALKSWCQEYESVRELQVVYLRSREKYSDAQKLAAVQHYLEHDRCIASTIKALGYPCRETLTVWIDERHPELRQRIVGRAPNAQHSLEYKNAAVIELCIRSTSAQKVAKKVAVSRPTLYNWKNQLLGREASASMKRHKDSGPIPKQKDLTELQQHVDLLERNIRRRRSFAHADFLGD